MGSTIIAVHQPALSGNHDVNNIVNVVSQPDRSS